VDNQISDGIAAYRVAVTPAQIADLRERLRRTRWPESEPVADWSQGMPLETIRHLCDDWLNDYDWRAVESEINGVGSFVARVDELDIHFLHVQSRRSDARPLLITHGWPGSIIEGLDVIQGLVDPPSDQPAFHVILPSLPGYGFSAKPAQTGWGLARIADAWAELMTRLGYDRFLAQGGDWGAMVTITLATRHPERVEMMHTTVPWAARPTGYDDARLSPVESRWLDEYAEFGRSGRGYALEQATRPQTVGYGLVDSPAGLLAWLGEKLHAFSDTRAGAGAVPQRRVLDTVSLYWFTASAASAARLYWESFHGLGMPDLATPVTVPAAVSVFPGELMKLPREWVEERFTDLRHWSVLDRGGHFPMLEVPEVFVAELRAAFAHTLTD